MTAPSSHSTAPDPASTTGVPTAPYAADMARIVGTALLASAFAPVVLVVALLP